VGSSPSAVKATQKPKGESAGSKERESMTSTTPADLAAYVPSELKASRDPQKDLPRIARDPKIMALVEDAVRRIPTHHDLHL